MEQYDFSEFFYNTVLKLKDADECRRLFEGVCTPKEIKAMAQRLMVAKMLDEGKVYENIVSLTGASTATISRVSRTTLPATRDLIKKGKENV